MAAMKEIVCACGCGRKKKVRVADINRGWGKYYSKSCKAKAQEKRTGQYRSFIDKNFSDHEDVVYEYGHIFTSGEEGHGQW